MEGFVDHAGVQQHGLIVGEGVLVEMGDGV
jgi:hypothetical protein